MFIIIEFDRKFSFGIDWYKRVKGVRLGFIAVHVINKRFEDVYRTLKGS
jgi:hypothetical protein